MSNNQLVTKTYSRQKSLNFIRLLNSSIKDLIASHFLAKQLAKRDISALYRQSYLGIIWLFITPIATALVWIILNLSKTVALADTGIPYPIYAFSGTLIWSIISEAINSPIITTNASRTILSKVNFPKEALVLCGIYKLLFNAGVKMIILFALVLFFGLSFDLKILLLPIALFGVIIFGTAIGLVLAPVGLLYTDISRLITLGLSLFMYITPVVYVVSSSGIMKSIMEINPFTPIVSAVRYTMFDLDFLYGNYFTILMVSGGLLFFIALAFYRFSIPIIVERISA